MTEQKSIDNLLAIVLEMAITSQASDVHATLGEPIRFRIDGTLAPLEFKELIDNRFSAADSAGFLNRLLDTTQENQLADRGSVDGAFSLGSGSRFRFNIYRRGGNFSFAFRHLADQIPSLESLGLRPQLYELCDLTDGLVLVAGPTGSGKSTTIAALVDRINHTRPCHIITVEDPVEFLHSSRMAMVNQRQIGSDVDSFHQALKDALRQDPDVILVGELRDLDTIRTAIAAAETGHLVFASVHAGDCKTAVERLVGAFGAEEQNLAQRLVATVLRTVIVQHLLPRRDNPNAIEAKESRRVLASEVMHVNVAVSNLIAGSNLNQLASIIQTSSDEGMWTLDDSLAKLWRSRCISEKTALALARNPETMLRMSRRPRA